jgi:cysteine dioxygenase
MLDERQQHILKPEPNDDLLEILENTIQDALLSTNETDVKREKVIEILRNLSPSKYDWRKFTFCSNNTYTRNLVIGNGVFEMLIICWDKNSKSPIHDHPSDGCWFAGIEGQVFEEKYFKNEKGILQMNSKQHLSKGQVGYMHDLLGFHAVGNPSLESIAVTLHIYSPPIKRCSIFKENGTSEHKVPSYYSKYGKVFK